MIFEELSEDIRQTYVRIAGKEFSVTYDANKYIGEVYRRMANLYRERARTLDAEPEKKEGDTLTAIAETVGASLDRTAMRMDLDREMYADALASDRYGIIHDWDQKTKAGKRVPPTLKNLMQVPGQALREIFRQCREDARPKDEGTAEETSATTSTTTSEPSSSPDTPTPADPVM
jgi:hypothetical protein